jgi:hypothetical protein
MKWTYKFKAILVAAAGLAFFSSCDKTVEYEPIGDGGQKIIRFADYGGYGPNFKNSNLSFDPTSTSEMVDLTLEYLGPVVPANDVTVTVEVDAAALDKYNATQTDPAKQFELLPAAAYTFPATTVKFKAGQVRSETFQVEFNPSQIDASKNLMLPLSVKAISGADADVKPASGTGTAYFHFIGNPLAGAYTVEGYFYHPSLPRPITRTGASGALSPLSDKELVTELGDLGASGYYAVLKVDDPYATTIQPVTVSVYPGSISPVFQWGTLAATGYTPAWPKSSLCNNTYDPATKTFYLRYGYSGSTGYRVSEEIIKKN